MNLTTVTEYSIAATPPVWLAWDYYLATHGFLTESMIIADWGRRYTFLPFFIGLVLGHWFFNQKSILMGVWWVFVPILVGLITWDIIWNANALHLNQVWYRYPGLWLEVGIATGTLVWAQEFIGSII